MGTITKSIGTTGRDYSTLQAWEDALPANLVTDGNAQVGECYNDSEFTAGVVISGHTTNATNYIRLTAASGQSFIDHASVQTNPLKYDQTKGVGITTSADGGPSPVVNISDQNYASVTRLQIKNTGTTYGNSSIWLNYNYASGADGVYADKCILQGQVFSGYQIARVGQNAYISNCCVINTKSNGGVGILLYPSTVASAYNCTVVAPSDLATKPSTGIHASYAGCIAKNCAVFGFTNDTNGANVTNTTCCTDDTSPSTGFTGSLTYTSQFEGTTAAAMDFRAKSGGGILDVGTNISATVPNTATDIVGTSRPQGSAYDVGCWELVTGGGGGGSGFHGVPYYNMMRGFANGA